MGVGRQLNVVHKHATQCIAHIMPEHLEAKALLGVVPAPSVLVVLLICDCQAVLPFLSLRWIFFKVAFVSLSMPSCLSSALRTLTSTFSVRSRVCPITLGA